MPIQRLLVDGTEWQKQYALVTRAEREATPYAYVDASPLYVVDHILCEDGGNIALAVRFHDGSEMLIIQSI